MRAGGFVLYTNIMTYEELWGKKAEAFGELLYTKIGRKDSLQLLANLHEVKLTALEAVVLSGRTVSREEMFELYCRALDELSAKWHGLPVLSSFPFDSSS